MNDELFINRPVKPIQIASPLATLVFDAASLRRPSGTQNAIRNYIMSSDMDILCPPPPFEGKRAKLKQSLDLAIASVTVLMNNYTITMRA